MATKKKTEKAVSRSEFEELKGGVSAILSILEKKDKADDLKKEPAKVETPEQKEVTKATANANLQPVPVEWREKAEEILGESLDHVELFYPRRGGQIFTVVITKDHTNAPADYLKFYKEDRRSKDIGNEGIEGVEQWCKLIKQNLNRPR